MAPFLLIRSWKVKKIVCSSIKKSFEKQGQVRKKEENLTSKTWNWKKGHFLPYSRLHCWCVCVHYDDFLCRLIQCILELFYWFLFFMSWQNFYEFETDTLMIQNWVTVWKSVEKAKNGREKTESKLLYPNSASKESCWIASVLSWKTPLL